MSTITENTIEGCIYGMAVGDAWGHPTEFKTHEQILQSDAKRPKRLVITDDTQMSLYNTEALKRLSTYKAGYLSDLATNSDKQDNVRKIFAEEHLKFQVDRDNNRAPGLTVMRALQDYRESVQVTGLEGSSLNNSRGCGTVMRAPWIGLFNETRENIALLAILQSETTHGDGQAAICSAIAALAVRDLVNNELLIDQPSAKGRLLAIEAYAKQTAEFVGNICSTITESDSYKNDVKSFILDYLDSLYLETVNASEEDLNNPDFDICKIFGQGWIANEALLCALAAFAIHQDNSYEGIRRLVRTNGDSDSIAAIGGAFFGVAHGYSELYNKFYDDGGPIHGSFEHRYELELIDAIRFYRSLEHTV